MDNKKPVDQVVEELKNWVLKNGKTPGEQAAVMRSLFDGLSQAILPQEEDANYLSAQNLVVEAVDENTGRLYRRYLEAGFEETDNGIRILGENISGAPVQIVFLSGTALARMKDLQGAGPDAPRCPGEHH